MIPVNPNESERAAGILSKEHAAEFQQRYGMPVKTLSDCAQVLSLFFPSHFAEPEPDKKDKRRA